MNEEQIQRILDNHKKSLERSKEVYHTVKKLDPEFMEKNRQRSNDWYQKNKEKRKQKYQNNKDLLNAKTAYYYWKKKDRLDFFKVNHKHKYDMLVSNGFLTTLDTTNTYELGDHLS